MPLRHRPFLPVGTLPVAPALAGTESETPRCGGPPRDDFAPGAPPLTAWPVAAGFCGPADCLGSMRVWPPLAKVLSRSDCCFDFGAAIGIAPVSKWCVNATFQRAFPDGPARLALTGIGGDARLVPLVASGLPLMSIVVPFGK